MGKNPKRGFMFKRLISAALTWDLAGKEEKEKKDTKNFRLITITHSPKHMLFSSTTFIVK
jgi:hypothetical protein